MAVRLEGSIKRFISEVGDEKPSVGYQLDGRTLTTTDLPPGSSLLELDSVNRRATLYHWTGAAWFAPSDVESLGSTLQAILFELASIKEAIIEGLA